ncbi:hypothetical protein [Streptomyces tremellae]|uniref:hypothetical protein n=1 Tax=Streptomyces tremellae TaxID=1124239 RepID=UPI0031EAA50B
MSAFFAEATPALVSHGSSHGLGTADSQIDTLLARLAGEVGFVEGWGLANWASALPAQSPKPASRRPRRVPKLRNSQRRRGSC